MRLRLEDQVAEFMAEKLGWDLPDHLVLLDDRDSLKRVRVLVEELSETVEAIHEGNIVKIADGLGDLVYVAIGTALAYGIPMGPVLDEIHRSNMTKENLNHWDKGGKGPNFEPPKLEEVLADAQGRRNKGRG